MHGEITGLTHIPSNIDGLNHETDYTQQCARWNLDVIDVLEWGDPDMYITVAGYAVTMSFVENPNGVAVQSASIRYCAPVLNMYLQLGLPRIVVNNDPRTYPKDQEMSLGWPSLIPAAILDQWVGPVIQTRVGGVHYKRHTRYARCESWCYLEKFDNLEEEPCVVLAHAHFTDGIRQKSRTEPWDIVLRGSDVPVYGKGWKDFNCNWQGPLDASEVFVKMTRAVTCPVVPHRYFYTGKPYVLEASNCIPIFYGSDPGDPWCGDPLGQFYSLDSSFRIEQPGELDRIVKSIMASEDLRWELRDQVSKACEPTWDVLDELLEYVEKGGKLPNYERFGGYEPV